jgi:hypothetical protein
MLWASKATRKGQMFWLRYAWSKAHRGGLMQTIGALAWRLLKEANSARKKSRTRAERWGSPGQVREDVRQEGEPSLLIVGRADRGRRLPDE